MTVVVRRQEVDELARLVRLLAHPLRPRMITELSIGGPRSPKGLSDRFCGWTRGDCNHHMHILRREGLVNLVDSRQVRGSLERIYRVEPRSRWPFGPRFQPWLSCLLPATCSAADPFVVALPLVLDAHGVADVEAATDTARTRAVELGRAVAKRLQSADPVNADRAVLIIDLLDQAEVRAAKPGGADNAS